MHKFIAVLVFLFALQAWAGEPTRVELRGAEAVVSHVEGYVTVVRRGGKKPQRIKRKDTLKGGDRVVTGRRSRIEITMPDKSLIRFDQRSSFTIASMAYNVEEKTKDSHFRMFMGRAWARVKKLGRRDRFQISSRTAVAGVRGTVYRMNVAEDSTTQVKVYWGDVVVHGRGKSTSQSPSSLAAPGKPQAPAPISGPSAVSGPTTVSGPKPVTMEAWTYIVSNMQQITVSPDGMATAPTTFTAEEDQNSWVEWNKTRDAALARPAAEPVSPVSDGVSPPPYSGPVAKPVPIFNPTPTLPLSAPTPEPVFPVSSGTSPPLVSE